MEMCADHWPNQPHNRDDDDGQIMLDVDGQTPDNVDVNADGGGGRLDVDVDVNVDDLLVDKERVEVVGGPATSSTIGGRRVCSHNSCPRVARKGGRCGRHQQDDEHERQSLSFEYGDGGNDGTSILKKQKQGNNNFNNTNTNTTTTTSISSHSLPRPSSTASLASSMIMISSGLDSKATNANANGCTIAIDNAVGNTNIGKKRTRSKKSEKRWTCPKCLGDVRLPPPAAAVTASAILKSVPEEEEEEEEEEPRKMNYQEEEVKAMLRMTPVMCARRGCAAPRYHLECSGLQVGSQIYRKTILTCHATSNRPVAAGNYYPALKDINYDANKILKHLYHHDGHNGGSGSSSSASWWELSPVINPKKDIQRSQQSLQSDVNWPTSPGSFMCPNCNVEGTARYLFEYFERFRRMKVDFYTDYLNVKNNSEEGDSMSVNNHSRLDRADESMEGRAGVAFLTHLMKDNQRDYQVKRQHWEGGGIGGDENNKTVVPREEDWNPSEIQLNTMSRILTILSKELQQEQIQQHQRRQKRQKTNFHIDPSYLVGMPVRMYNPIDKQYHTGRIVDYKFNAPYQVDDHQRNTKPSSSPDNVGDLVDEKICRTMYLVRFRHGVEGRRIAVHQWIYLEEHAVTVGGEICWARVGDDPGGNGQAGAASVKKGSSSGQPKSTDGTAKERMKECVSNYRPVQIIFRSMLEMIPVQNLNSGLSSPSQNTKSCTSTSQGGEICNNGSSGLKVLAMGFGMAFSQVRLFLGGNGKKLMKDKQSNQENELSAEPVVRPDAIPLTSSIPPWINQILRRSHFDDDVGMGLAVACMEKEEERRVRTWRNLSVAHLSPPGDSQPSLLIKSKTKVSCAASSSVSSSSKSKKRVSVQSTVPSSKRKKPFDTVSAAASGSKESKKGSVQAPSAKAPSKTFDPSVEISLEDAASFGCKKCIKEIETGVKTPREHDPGCPRKKSAKPHAVPLDVCASIGCKKCMKELASGVRSPSYLRHDVGCPRRRDFSGTIPSKVAKKSRIRQSPNPPVIHQSGASATMRNGSIQKKKSIPPLDLCASVGCAKCIEQLASGTVDPNAVHDEKCPRSQKRGAMGTSPAKTKISKKRSGQPKGPVVHQPSAAAVNGNGDFANFRNSTAAMDKQRCLVKAGDPRPCGGCEFCGPIEQINRKVTTTVADIKVGDLCAACQMLKNDGWLYEYREKGRKKRFTNPNTGRHIWSVREFLGETTDIVSKRMKNSSKLK